MVECAISTYPNSEMAVARFTKDGEFVGDMTFDAARLKTGPKVRFCDPLYQEAFDKASA